MGLGILSSNSRSTCACGAVAEPTPPNPNPLRFHVQREEVVAGKSLLLVKYAGCTTFDGTKLLLLKRKWTQGETLDPHLLGGNHIVLARFEPTEQGWAMARQCALMSNEKS